MPLNRDSVFLNPNHPKKFLDEPVISDLWLGRCAKLMSDMDNLSAEHTARELHARSTGNKHMQHSLSSSRAWSIFQANSKSIGNESWICRDLWGMSLGYVGT